MNCTILAGDYKGPLLYSKKYKCLYFQVDHFLSRTLVLINTKTVESYNVIEEQTKSSFGSGVARGIAGGAIFGPIGALAGAASAKKQTKHKIAIYFKNGNKSLIELDDEGYNLFLKGVF